MKEMRSLMRDKWSTPSVQLKISTFLNDSRVQKELLAEVNREKKIVEYFNEERRKRDLFNIESGHHEWDKLKMKGGHFEWDVWSIYYS